MRFPALLLALAACALPAPAAGGPWSSWDLTPLVSDWASGTVPNRGLLLELAEEEENFGTSGPYFSSSTFASITLRPRLVISYVTPAGLSP